MLGFDLLSAAAALRCGCFHTKPLDLTRAQLGVLMQDRPQAHDLCGRKMLPEYCQFSRAFRQAQDNILFASVTCTSPSAGEPVRDETPFPGHPKATPQALIRISIHIEILATPGNKPSCSVSRQLQEKVPKTTSITGRPSSPQTRNTLEVCPSSSSHTRDEAILGSKICSRPRQC